jgi:flagellar basal-body rod protein FlgG
MIQSFFSAKLGMKAQQARLDTIANNIANINTTAYKKNSVSFKDALYSIMGNGLVNGTGVVIAATSKSFEQGIPIETGVNMDFMINGNGFFTVAKADGTLAYTRDGSFAISSETTGNHLVTSHGDYVLDENGHKIDVPQGTSDIQVNSDGVLSTKTGQPIATLGIATFDNREGLSADGNGNYVPTAVSGSARKATAYSVKNGFLEGSNVDLSTEMMKLISTQRAYSLAGKALQTVDEMHRLANNLRS